MSWVHVSTNSALPWRAWISSLTILCSRAIDNKTSWRENMVLLSRPLMGKSGFVYLFVYLIDWLFVCFKRKLFYEKYVGSQARTLPDVGLLVCPWVTSDQQIHYLKWILTFPSAGCLDGNVSVQSECVFSYFLFTSTEKDLSMLFRYLINIAKLIKKQWRHTNMHFLSLC